MGGQEKAVQFETETDREREIENRSRVVGLVGKVEGQVWWRQRHPTTTRKR